MGNGKQLPSPDCHLSCVPSRLESRKLSFFSAWKWGVRQTPKPYGNRTLTGCRMTLASCAFCAAYKGLECSRPHMRYAAVVTTRIASSVYLFLSHPEAPVDGWMRAGLGPLWSATRNWLVVRRLGWISPVSVASAELGGKAEASCVEELHPFTPGVCWG